jgi:hypothetical protein
MDSQTILFAMLNYESIKDEIAALECQNAWKSIAKVHGMDEFALRYFGILQVNTFRLESHIVINHTKNK